MSKDKRKAYIYPVIYCECGSAMYYEPPAPKTIACQNRLCEFFMRPYKAPTIELEPIEELIVVARRPTKRLIAR